MVSEVSCCGDLLFDIEESRESSIPIYTCQNCGKMYYLKVKGIKPRGWKTKKMLDYKKEIEMIPF